MSDECLLRCRVNDMPDQDAIQTKFESFCQRFRYRYWKGPFFTGPEVTNASDDALPQDVPAHWVVWMEKPGVPDSRGTRPDNARIRATLRFSDTDAAEIAIETIAQRMVGIVAGLEAHEVLEFARLDDSFAVHPHGTLAELHDIAALISEVIVAAPRSNTDTGAVAATDRPDTQSS
jgi:hypothetical protein